MTQPGPSNQPNPTLMPAVVRATAHSTPHHAGGTLSALGTATRSATQAMLGDGGGKGATQDDNLDGRMALPLSSGTEVCADCAAVPGWWPGGGGVGAGGEDQALPTPLPGPRSLLGHVLTFHFKSRAGKAVAGSQCPPPSVAGHFGTQGPWMGGLALRNRTLPQSRTRWGRGRCEGWRIAKSRVGAGREGRHPQVRTSASAPTLSAAQIQTSQQA